MNGLEQIELQKKELLARIEGWSAARLNYRPSVAGAWSTAEVLDHLVKTEAAILEVTKQGLAKPHRIGLKNRLGFLFIEWLFRSERRVKVPASASQVLPDQAPDMEAIAQRWQTVRKDLNLFCGQLSPDQARTGIFKHPVSGWMSMPQVVGFFSVHMVHHGFQLSRLSVASQGL